MHGIKLIGCLEFIVLPVLCMYTTGNHTTFYWSLLTAVRGVLIPLSFQYTLRILEHSTSCALSA